MTCPRKIGPRIANEPIDMTSVGKGPPWSHEDPWEELLRTRVANLTALWEVSGAAQAIVVCFSPRLSRSVGRANFAKSRISLATWLQSDQTLLDQALCHELAHIIAFHLVGRSEPPHGPRWQTLMRLAGYEPSLRLAMTLAPASEIKSVHAHRYRHRCPTCGFTRTAGRRMVAWRCADCAAAGLDGRLEIEAAGARR